MARQFDAYYDGIWQSIPAAWQSKGARPDPESPDSGTSCTDGVDNDFDNLADANDPGCLKESPPLPDLPPHRIVTRRQYEKLQRQYPMVRPTACDPGYPDWYVCLSANSGGRCSRLPYRNFTAKESDPQGLDGDGIACER